MVTSTRKVRNLLIILVGPQAAGKTTQATLLLRRLKSLGCVSHMTELVHYTIFHLKFLSSLNKLCRKNTILIKFYEDLPSQPSCNPEIIKRLFGLLILLHFIGYVISLVKYKILRLSHQILVEHEGFVFKQIADLYFLAFFVGVKPNSLTGKLLKRFSCWMLSNLLKERVVVIRLEVDTKILRQRYATRPHIEPVHYICFQQRVYRKLVEHLAKAPNVNVFNVDSSQEVSRTFLNIFNSILSVLESQT